MKHPSKTKERWQLAEKVAKVLGISKQSAWAGLSCLEEEKLIDKILEGDQDAIEKAKSLKWCYHDGETKKPETSVGFGANIEHVRVMMWAIQKIGSSKQAKDAFKRALKALE